MNNTWRHSRTSRTGTVNLRRGFTVIELLVVMTVIAALMAMGLASMAILGERAAQRQTAALISSVATAISNASAQQGSSIYLGDGRAYLRWYVSGGTSMNPEGLLDGNPSIDPSFDGTLRAHAAAVDYRGPAEMLDVQIPDRHLDPDTGRIIDAWGYPLRVLDIDVSSDHSPYAGNTVLRQIVAAGSLGVWSVGPNGDPLDTSDNYTSWGSQEEY